MVDFWTREAIWNRYLEAFDTLRRLPNNERFRLRAGWPQIIRDYGDAVAAEEQRAAEGYQFDPSWSRPAPATPEQISRMERLWAWHVGALGEDGDLARLLIMMAWARGTGFGIVRILKPLRVTRRTAYNRRDDALEIVREWLVENSIAIREAA